MANGDGDSPEVAGGGTGAAYPGTEDVANTSQAAADTERLKEAQEAYEASTKKTKPLLDAIKTNLSNMAKAAAEVAQSAQTGGAELGIQRDHAQATLDLFIQQASEQAGLKSLQEQATAAAEAAAGAAWKNLSANEKKEASLSKEIELRGQIRGQVAEEIAKNESILSSSVKIKDLADAKNQSETATKASLMEQVAQYRTVLELLDKGIKEKKTLEAATKKNNTAVNQWADRTSNVLGTLTGVKDHTGSITHAILSNKKGTQEWSDAVQGVQKGFKDTLSNVNILISSFEKAQEAALYLARNEWDVAKSLNDASKGFMRSTGAGEKYRDTVYDIAQANKDMIPSYDKAAQMAGELYNNMFKFSQLGPELQSQLTRFATVMERVGVQSGTTVEMLNTMTKTLRMTEQDAMTATSGLTGFAQQLGVSTNTALKNFTQLSKDYASFGGPALIKTFRNMQVLMKETGAEMGTFLGIAKKFDTFEGAASSVGELNAVLGGGYLNTLKMVNTIDPAERIMLVKDAVEKAGMSFDGMGKKSHYLKKTIAEMFTGGDMAEAEKIFGSQSSAIRQAQSAAEGYKGTLQGLEGQAKKNETMEEARSSRQMTMAKHTKDLSAGIDKLNELLQGMAGIAGTLGPIFGSLFGGMVSGLTQVIAKQVIAKSGLLEMGKAAQESAGPVSELVNQVDLVGDNAKKATDLAGGMGSSLKTAGMTALKGFGWVATITIGLKSLYSLVQGFSELFGSYGAKARNFLGMSKAQSGQGGMNLSNAIPGMAQGRDGATGMARVHAGEVLVNLPNNTNVISNANIKRQENNISTLKNVNRSVMQMLNQPVERSSPAQTAMAQDLKRIAASTRETTERIVTTAMQKETRDTARFRSEMSVEQAQLRGSGGGGGGGNVQVTVKPTPIHVHMDGREIYKMIAAWNNAHIGIN